MELQMRNLTSENSDMSSVAEARELVQRVAEPRGASIKASIARAARRLEWSYSRTRDVWYGDARRINSHEMDRLREEAERVEIRMHIGNLVALRQRLAATDAQFHRQTIAALDDALRGLGAQVGTVDVRDGSQE